MTALLRPVRTEEMLAIADLWFASARVAHPYLPMLKALDSAQAREVFTRHVMPGLEIVVAEADGKLAGFLGMDGCCLDRLYIVPAAQGQGVGSQLLDAAKRRCPEGLELFTHQKNARARRFYEARGFRAVRFGISGPPESEPDVCYRWSPAS